MASVQKIVIHLQIKELSCFRTGNLFVFSPSDFFKSLTRYVLTLKCTGLLLYLLRLLAHSGSNGRERKEYVNLVSLGMFPGSSCFLWEDYSIKGQEPNRKGCDINCIEALYGLSLKWTLVNKLGEKDAIILEHVNQGCILMWKMIPPSRFSWWKGQIRSEKLSASW